MNNKKLDNLDLDSTNELGETTLMNACQNGDYEFVKHLLDIGVNVNRVVKSGNTALLSICRMDTKNSNECDIKMNIIKLLIHKGAHINHKNYFGESSIFITCLMFSKYPELWCEYYEILKFLVKSGADVNSKDVFGSTPLLYACSKGDMKLIIILISVRANANHCDDKGNTPISYAYYRHDLDMAKLLINTISKTGQSIIKLGNLFLKACSTCGDELNFVKLFIEGGANINHVDELGNTGLSIACYFENIEISKLLLKQKVNVNTVNIKDLTPLMTVCRCGDLEIVSLLVESGADINYINRNNDSALTYACLNNRIDVVKFLISKGAVISNKINYNTIFILCYHLQYFDNIKILTSAGYNYLELCKYFYDDRLLDLTYYIRMCLIDFDISTSISDREYENYEKGVIKMINEYKESKEYIHLKRKFSEPVASDIFSCIVFISDNYYNTKTKL